MKFARRAAIGLPITLVAVGLMSGFENLLFILLVSIVCTYGVGAIGWLLVSYLVGAIIDILILSRYERRRLAEFEKKLAGESADVQAVARYFVDARKHNMNDEDVRRVLRAAGWSREVIERAFDML